MTDRPEWIKCIRQTHVDLAGKTWCGKSAIGFCFVDVDHAAQNGLQQGRLVACPECVEAVVAALHSGDE